MPKHVTNGLPFGKAERNVSSLTTGSRQEQDGVDGASATNLFRSFFLFGNPFFDDLPLLFCQVCAIMQCHFHVTLLGDAGLFFQKRKRNMVFTFDAKPIPPKIYVVNPVKGLFLPAFAGLGGRRTISSVG